MYRFCSGLNSFFIYNYILYWIYISVTFLVGDMSIIESEDPDLINDYSTYDHLNYCDPTEHNKTCCYSDEFQCGNGECIKPSLVCNGKIDYGRGIYKIEGASMDCRDGSDEYGCTEMPCKLRTRGHKCNQACVDYPNKRSQCSCYKGYMLSGSNKCIDIDECYMGVHSCSHGCTNLNGSFTCICHRGFKKVQANSSFLRDTHCQLEDENVFVLYNYKSWIYFYNIKTKKREPIVESGKVDSIDIDPLKDIVYWTNSTTMCRSYIPGAKNGYVTSGHTQTLQMPEFKNKNDRRIFSLDWTTGNVYWVRRNLDDTTNTDIVVSKLNSSRVSTLLFKLHFYSLVVDPPSGDVFWIAKRWGTSSIRQYLIPIYISNPNTPLIINQDAQSLITDHQAGGKIYWVDYKTQTIYSRSKWNYHRIEAIHTTSEERGPVALDVFDGYIYWLTNQTNEIMRIDEFGKGRVEVLLKFEGKPSSNILKIYHSSKVDKEMKYGGQQCTHFKNFCFYDDMYKGITIKCPDGVKRLTRDPDSCNITQEPPLNDPLDCNCNELTRICDKQSPHYDCDCQQHYRCQPISFHKENYTIEDQVLSKNRISTFGYVILIFIIIIITLMFGLSFFKRML